MIVVCSLYWDANALSESHSTRYTTEWVDRLAAGFRRNLSQPHVFRLYTDRRREYSENVDQVVVPGLGRRGYVDCILPYRERVPMILVGLDTVVTGCVDELAEHCLRSSRLALPRDPSQPSVACNGVALIPRGLPVASMRGATDDMAWARLHPHDFLDDLFPGWVVSYKGHARQHGLGDARIVYFHGDRKPDQLVDRVPWVAEHWRI